MDYEVQSVGLEGRPKKTRREVMERKECQTIQLNKEDAMDCHN